MPLYEIVKADGTREKMNGDGIITDYGTLSIYNAHALQVMYAPGTWLEVWRREGVGE